MTNDKWIDKINGMSHVELATLYRFAPAGHPEFTADSPVSATFEKRFKELGGMTPSVSKQVGWGEQ
jgi:hypothetical protein